MQIRKINLASQMLHEVAGNKNGAQREGSPATSFAIGVPGSDMYFDEAVSKRGLLLTRHDPRQCIAAPRCSDMVRIRSPYRPSDLPPDHVTSTA
jgi:hypothetical protein